jgi:hypothetical protein
MKYMKVNTEDGKHHLAVADEFSTESITLCGCVVTRAQGWTWVWALDGDECERCAKIAFGGGAAMAAP